MSIRKRLFDDEGVGGVVAEDVAKSRGFGGALGGVVVACVLDDATEFAVGVGEAWVGFLRGHNSKFFAERGFA